MAKEQTYCAAPGCEEPTKEGRRYCPRDTKRFQRQRAGKSAPPLGAPAAERLPPMERAIEAMSLLLETPAEDDVLYAKRRREVEAIISEMGKRARPEAIRRGIERARAQGKRIGRPPKLLELDQHLLEMVERFGRPVVAKLLRVDPKTLAGAIRRHLEGTVSPGVQRRPQEKATFPPGVARSA